MLTLVRVKSFGSRSPDFSPQKKITFFRIFPILNDIFRPAANTIDTSFSLTTLIHHSKNIYLNFRFQNFWDYCWHCFDQNSQYSRDEKLRPVVPWDINKLLSKIFLISQISSHSALSFRGDYSVPWTTLQQTRVKLLVI